MHDINYSEIIKKAWNITWNNKWLWVYGLVLAILGSSSSYSGNGSSSGSSSSRSLKDIPKQIPEQTQKVLGDTTNAIIQWASSIPISTWILIAISFSAIIIVWIVITWIARTWAKAGLIIAIKEASLNSKTSLLTSSSKSFSTIKNLLIYDLLIGGISFVIFFIYSILLIVCIFLTLLIPIIGIILSIALALLSVLVLIVFILLISIMSVYSERLIVSYGYPPMAAMKKSFYIAKKYALNTVIMGLINSAVGCGVGCITAIIFMIIALPFILYGVTLYQSMNQGSNIIYASMIPVIGIGILVFFIITVIISCINALYIVWKYSTWNEFFQSILAFKEFEV